MARRRRLWTFVLAAGMTGAAGAVLFSQLLPELGAGALLHPARREVSGPPPDRCESARFEGAGVELAGWRCRAMGERRGTAVVLHGVADNRASAAGVVGWFTSRGFDALAYDSRAHGDSGGEACTYGFYEKRDLRRVLDAAGPGPIVLLGTSLGGAVALQLAAEDARARAVIAAETFSDLRTLVAERAPFFVPAASLDRVFRVAERRAAFSVDAVSPVEAAARITAPVLLIHGADDVDTVPEHSRRVYAALGGPKRLILVPGAKHNESLNGNVWEEIGRWLDAALARRPAGAPARGTGGS